MASKMAFKVTTASLADCHTEEWLQQDTFVDNEKSYVTYCDIAVQTFETGNLMKDDTTQTEAFAPWTLVYTDTLVNAHQDNRAVQTLITYQ